MEITDRERNEKDNAIYGLTLNHTSLDDVYNRAWTRRLGNTRIGNNLADLSGTHDLKISMVGNTKRRRRSRAETKSGT